MASLDELRSHRADNRRTILELFETDPRRVVDFSLEFDGLLFDYSKTSLDRHALDGLVELSRRSHLPDRIRGMFEGDKINASEGRAVLHTALRSAPGKAVIMDGIDVAKEAGQTLDRMERFASAIRSGELSPVPNRRVSDIVHIGIGGSDLGPAMATEALAPFAQGPAVHFVSNIDGSQIDQTLRRLDPATTMVVVVSKTFRTIETLTNARTARQWIVESEGEEGVHSRFVGISSNLGETGAFGIDPEKVFGFGDWVGGRYSIWGPVGLSLMIAIGARNFRDFLEGARSIDSHFCTADFRQNMPVLLAFAGLWHNQICGYGTRAVLPYDQRLSQLPAYLQQLEMESNGKSVTLDGSLLEEESAPVVWGEPGTNGQHAFHQMLHQGTQVVPCEFLVAAEGHEPELRHHHDILVANCLAQARALMVGSKNGSSPDSSVVLESHKACPGNRPSTVLAYPKLTPRVLGQIIALYEHKVFVEGVILGINSFDQWGVELGKKLATELVDCVSSGSRPAETDPSTGMLLDFIRKARR